MSAIIELKNVSKSFGGITALKKASIKVDVGEVVGLAVEKFGPDFASILPACRIWVNGNPAKEDDKVFNSDEVAILPPVSGGAYE